MSGDNKFNRRTFFQNSLIKSKSAVFKVVDIGMKLKFRRKFIRPPGAIKEDQFLLTCTRCDKCVTACPYKAIHIVKEIHAGILLNTPFIDPFYEPCRFCEDMPCIVACADGALVLTEKIPPIGIAEVKPEHCLVTQGQHCDYCFNSCPNNLKAITKNEKGVPQIDADLCIGCGKCAYICVSQSDKAIVIKPF